MDERQKQEQSGIDRAKDQAFSSLKTAWSAAKNAKKIATVAKKALGAIKTALEVGAAIATVGVSALGSIVKRVAVKAVKVVKWLIKKAFDAIKGLFNFGWGRLSNKQRAIGDAGEEKPFYKKIWFLLLVLILFPFVFAFLRLFLIGGELVVDDPRT